MPAKSRFRLLQEKIACSKSGRWIIKTFVARPDPIVFKMTGGRYTLTGPPAIPQLLLTTKGRKSGKPRDVQLVYTDIDGAIVVVASNFGRNHHPAWSHNLDANPGATILIDGKTVSVTAERLPQHRVDEIWERLVDNIPMYGVYVRCTDRTIKVYRLDPAGNSNRGKSDV